MIRSGLINVFNLTIINYKEMTELKINRKNLTKLIVKLKITDQEKLNKKSVTSSINNVPLTHLYNKPDDKVSDLNFDTIANFIEENLQYRVTERYLTRTEIIMDTIIIRATRITYVFDNGWTKYENYGKKGLTFWASVSYTHLDVYKRQVLCTAVTIHHRT